MKTEKEMGTTIKEDRKKKISKSVHSDKLPIWLSDWVIKYTTPSGRKTETHNVRGVVVKGKDKDSILSNREILRKVVHVHKERKTKIDDEMLSSYSSVSVDLIKQVGEGVNENNE